MRQVSCGALLKIGKCHKRIPLFANRWIGESKLDALPDGFDIADTIAYGLTACIKQVL